MTILGRIIRPDAIVKSQEREITEDDLRPSCNVFDRLGQSRGEDMRTYLEVRRTSATNDEINELRARLEKLAARNTEAAPSTLTSPFSAEIQQAPLPTRFKYRLWRLTRERPTLKTIWMPSMARWTCFRSPFSYAADVLQSRC